jgi:hypothetical protein
MSVVTMDSRDPNAASRNAAGIVCRHWYKQNTISGMTPVSWTSTDVNDGIKFLEEFGLEKTGEIFTSYMCPEEKFRDDCYLVPSCNILESQVVITEGTVSYIVPLKGVVRVVTSLGNLYARRVVVAAGVHTDELLRASGLPVIGVRRLRGRALIARVESPLDIPVTHMSRPYTHWTVRNWGNGLVRVGDTVEKTFEGGDSRLGECRRVLRSVCGSATEMRVLDGYRPVCKQFTVCNVAERVVAATGGHRVGLALAGLVARKCLELLQ